MAIIGLTFWVPALARSEMAGGLLNWDKGSEQVDTVSDRNICDFVFHGRNLSNDAIEITSIVPDCGCTELEAFPRQIPAGGTVVLDGIYELRGHVGRQKESIRVTARARDGRIESSVLELVVNINEAVEISPRIICRNSHQLSEEVAVNIVFRTQLVPKSLKVNSALVGLRTRLERVPDSRLALLWIDLGAVQKDSRGEIRLEVEWEHITRAFSIPVYVIGAR